MAPQIVVCATFNVKTSNRSINVSRFFRLDKQVADFFFALSDRQQLSFVENRIPHLVTLERIDENAVTSQLTDFALILDWLDFNLLPNLSDAEWDTLKKIYVQYGDDNNKHRFEHANTMRVQMLMLKAINPNTICLGTYDGQPLRTIGCVKTVQ